MQWRKQTASLAALLSDMRRTLDAADAAQDGFSGDDAPVLPLAGTRQRGATPAAGSAAVAPAIDYPRLAAAITSAMKGVTVQMDGRAVGALVEPTVSEQIAKATKLRR